MRWQSRCVPRSTPNRLLLPLLARRAPQHAGHRQLGHRGAGRPHRRQDPQHPGRLGGIMLPNHAPLVVAEAFGHWPSCTWAHRFGLGRRPVPIRRPCAALRRDRPERGGFSPRGERAQQLLGPPAPGQRIVATPARVPRCPSGCSARASSPARPAAERAAHALRRTCATPAAAGAGAVPQPFPSLRVSPAPCDHRCAGDRGAGRRRGSTTSPAAPYQRARHPQRRPALPPPPVEGFRAVASAAVRAIDDFLAAAVIGGLDRVAAGFASSPKLRAPTSSCW